MPTLVLFLFLLGGMELKAIVLGLLDALVGCVECMIWHAVPVVVGGGASLSDGSRAVTWYCFHKLTLSLSPLWCVAYLASARTAVRPCLKITKLKLCCI